MEVTLPGGKNTTQRGAALTGSFPSRDIIIGLVLSLAGYRVRYSTPSELLIIIINTWIFFSFVSRQDESTTIQRVAKYHLRLYV